MLPFGCSTCSRRVDDANVRLELEADAARMGRILDGTAELEGTAAKAVLSMKLAAAAGVRESGLIVAV